MPRTSQPSRSAKPGGTQDASLRSALDTSHLVYLHSSAVVSTCFMSRCAWNAADAVQSRFEADVQIVLPILATTSTRTSTCSGLLCRWMAVIPRRATSNSSKWTRTKTAWLQKPFFFVVFSISSCAGWGRYDSSSRCRWQRQ